LSTFLVAGINDEGTITGSFSTPGRTHGFIRDPEGNFTTFDPPGSISTMAQGINAGGAVTGFYQESNNVDHGFVRGANGKLISFDPRKHSNPWSQHQRKERHYRVLRGHEPSFARLCAPARGRDRIVRRAGEHGDPGAQHQ
jgi:hypothetical protein